MWLSLILDTGGEFKKWGNMPLKQAVFLFQLEYRPPLVLEKDRTSLRKLNSPPVSYCVKTLAFVKIKYTPRVSRSEMTISGVIVTPLELRKVRASQETGTIIIIVN